MLTYQIRPRIFRLKDGEQLFFPSDVELRFHFKPDQPFGMTPGGGRTAVRDVAARLLFNQNTGAHTIESQKPLNPLDVTIIEESIRTVQFKGNVLTIRQQFDTLDKLHDVINSIYFGLPLLLNLSFADPPIIECVDGHIGSCTFRWELSDWRMEVRTTTQKEQEVATIDAWRRMNLLSESTRRRLVAALHYFHVACRLSRQGNTPGEFLAEVLLNLAKTLEVLFPPTGNGLTREAVRSGLKALGFSSGEIEGNFMPALAIRNELDVAHVELGLFTMKQLRILHAYTERTENVFRDMLKRVLEGILAGTFEVSICDLGTPRREALAVIERLQQYTPDDVP